MQRLLRTYHYIAQVEHFCDRCCQQIHPGEYYERQVWLTERGVLVLKEHIEPECDWPTEPEFDEDEDSTEGAETLPWAA